VQEDEVMKDDQKTNLSDAELARLAAAGDPAAFAEIHHRYRGFVYAIALRMTRNEPDAEDMTQESFLRLLRRIGSFRGDALFTTWLYRVVVNEVKMHFRVRNSRREVQVSEAQTFERDRTPLHSPYSGQVIDRLAIKEAVRSLPPGCRTAFILHDVEGYKHIEGALILGRSNGTSKSQLHKARIRLRDMLSPGNANTAHAKYISHGGANRCAPA
jgi:RNA polymerase sigma-70 factor (ECF subfamily)